MGKLTDRLRVKGRQFICGLGQQSDGAIEIHDLGIFRLEVEQARRVRRAAAAFQEITPNRMRGQVSAVYLFWLNLAGIGFGSTIVALVTELFYGGDLGVSRALATVTGVAAALSASILAAPRAPYRRAVAAHLSE